MMKIKFGDLGVVVFEPADYSRIISGKFAKVQLKDFDGCKDLVIAYCPDIVRLSIDLGNLGHPVELEEFEKMLKESQEWRALDRSAN